jgi:hypothetical protein
VEDVCMIGVRGKGYRIYTSLLDFFSGLELLANEVGRCN